MKLRKKLKKQSVSRKNRISMKRMIAGILLLFHVGLSSRVDVLAQTIQEAALNSILGSISDQSEKYAARNTYSGVSAEDAGTTEKKYTPKITQAATKQYKDMDYTFLKSFAFGTTYKGTVTLVYTNVESLRKSNLYNLKSGVIVRTKRYYNSKDGGGAVYEISDKAATGALLLDKGLYANLIPDTYVDPSGKSWYVTSIKQYGALGDGVKAENEAFYNNLTRLAEYTNETSAVERGIAYVPEGEYKCDNQIFIGVSNINIVGDGEKSILFTDNDYRKTQGYSEHFFTVWGAKNLYLGDFVLEAREVDLYHYMRQFSILYASDIYIKNVDMLIPENCYNCYYYEDKQYSNLCFYTGNKNITVDGCKMEQMTGTYRGANVGILDIWSAGEENITVMNCDIYGNARDEQIGIFSTDKESAYVHNVEFINNRVYAYQPKYIGVVGTATMRFTIAYSDSKNIDNIHIAGNHFKVECDSKFITFGKLTNCVIEDNIMELLCTYSTWSIGIESNSYVKEEDIKIRHNDIFVSTNEGKGKGNLLSGNMTFSNNRVFSDVSMPFGILGSRQENNEIICLKEIGYLSAGANTIGNKIHVYQGFGTNGGQSNRQAALLGTNDSSDTKEYSFSSNTIYNYERADTTANFQSLLRFSSNFGSYIIKDNCYYSPNVRYIKTDNYACVDKTKDAFGDIYYLRLFRNAKLPYPVTVSGNTLQGVNCSGLSDDSSVIYTDNKLLEFTKNLSDTVTSRVEIRHKGKTVTELTTSEASIDLDDIEYVALDQDSKGNVLGEKEVSDKDIIWYTSVEEIGTVSKDGVVTRQGYGSIQVYAVPLDGSKSYGKCTLTFAKSKASAITAARDEIVLQPGLRAYAGCSVWPEGAASKLLYQSSDTTVATVTNTGRIEAVATGEADITCSTTDGSEVSKVIHIRVQELTVKKINLNQAWLAFNHSQIGETYQLAVVSYSPDNAVNTGVSRWESTNEEVASVSSTGLVKLKGSGSATLHAYSMDGSCSGKCVVYIQPPSVKGLQAQSVGMDSITISWEEVPRCGSYNVYKWEDATKEWVNVNTGIKKNSYTFHGLTPKTTYQYCVKAAITNWSAGYPYPVYEGNEAVITCTTASEVKTTGIDASMDHITLIAGTEPIWEVGGKTNSNITITVKALPNDVAVNDLAIEMEDDTIATLVKAERNNKGGYNLYIRGEKAGYTKLILKTTDGTGIIKKIPVGVFDNVKISDKKGSTEYRKIKLKFKAISDESAIDGYVISRSQGYRYVDQRYIKKTGDSDYEYVIQTGLTPGETYRYHISVYSERDGIYYERNRVAIENLVMPNTIYIENINVGDKISYLDIGKSIHINAVVTPTDASIQTLDWIIDDESVAKLELRTDNQGIQYGKITALKEGTATLKLLSQDGSEIICEKTIVVYKNKLEEVTPVFTIHNSNNGIKIKWNRIKGASGYYIYRKTGNSDWSKIDTVEGEAKTSYKDKNVKSGKVYRYTVKAYSENEVSSYNTAGSRITYLSVPVIKTLENQPSGIKIKWSGIKGAKGYYIYKKTGSGAWLRIAAVAGEKKCIYWDKNTVNGKKCIYKVRAYSGTSISSACSDSSIYRLTRPVLHSVSRMHSKALKLKWSKNKKSSGYEIKYATGKATKIITKKGNTNTSTMLPLFSKGKTYKISIRSYKTVKGKKFYSSWSLEKKVK